MTFTLLALALATQVAAVPAHPSGQASAVGPTPAVATAPAVPAVPDLSPPIPPVDIVVYSDFQCPYCQQFSGPFRELQTKGIDGVETRVTFKHFPLSIHPNAQLAHQAALAAKAQGKFWEMHDLLFADQQHAQRADLVGYARKLGLDVARFEKDMDGDAVKQSIAKDIEVQFPSYTDVVGDADVVSTTDAAWTATKADATATQRRERGFWIKLNTATEKYEFGTTDFGAWVTDLQTGSVTPSAKPADNPASPTPTDTPTYTVAYIHTHTPTFYRTVGRAVGPSGADINFHNSQNVVGIAYDYVGDASGNAPAGWPLNSPAQRYNAGPTRRSTP